ncbi:hypothetical protein Q7P37_003759 [Cladosporium fusiforme]
MSRSSEPEDRLSSTRRLDIWEHACLLYHNFDWQNAADIFQMLEQAASSPYDKTIFALNRGLIEARLGDFHTAANTWKHALPVDQQIPITYFLLGLVNVELGDHAKAHRYFKSSFERLPEQGLDCRTYGLDFDLTASAVRENIERLGLFLGLQAADLDDGVSMQPFLNVIPADIIFEAPSRTSSISQSASSVSEAKWTKSEVVHEGGSEVSSSLSRDKVISAQSSHHSAQGVSAREGSKSGQHWVPMRPHLPEKSAASTPTHVDSILPAPAKSYPKLAPKNPQTRDESTRELAHFLRHAGPSGDENVTVDREYMLRLLQSDTARLGVSRIYDGVTDAPEHPDLLEDPHSDLESLLDFYYNHGQTEVQLSGPSIQGLP